MNLRRNLLLLTLSALLLVGCVSAGVTPIGSNSLAPLPSGSAVQVYSDEQQIERPYKVIGLLSYSNPGRYRILSLSDVIPDLKEQARRAGANGIIIDETQIIKSGIISTGIGVTGRAIAIQE